MIVRFGSVRRLVAWSVVAVGLAALILSPAAASGGQRGRLVAHVPLAGSLDPSFGTSGVVTQSLAAAEAIAVQPDGKIVVAGSAAASAGLDGFALARYLPDGTPDPSFGDAGYVATNLYPPASYAGVKAIALQADGKIVVAGTSDGLESENPEVLHQFTLARYNPNGSLDTSFGMDGLTNTVIPQPSSSTPWWAGAYALAVLPNGEILAGGSAGWSAFPDQSSFALVRYTPDGSLDPAFGDGGIVQTAFSGYDYLAGIAVQPDGKIVAAGSNFGSGHGNDWDSMSLARYEPDGSLDPTFGKAGKVTTAHKLAYDGGPPALQNGKILVAGFTRRNSSSRYFPVIGRYQANGRPDPNFGGHGFAELKRVPDGPSAVLTQTNGKILIAAGHSVVRLLPNGRLDTSFGRRGVVSLGHGLSMLALQADEKILVGEANGNSAPTLARLLGGNNCVVPRLRGNTVSKARKKLRASYCRTGRISRLFSTRVARGHVISTATPLGDRLPDGTKVDLVVSRGKRTQRG
jgi:uncharacterized delta-60 repeat protein